jgi:hypothetical protein
MKNLSRIMLCVVLFSAIGAFAQVPIDNPVKIDIGLGGGVTMPNGTLSDGLNTGWHAGAKIRLHGFMPLSIVGLGSYHRLAQKAGSESSTEMMLGAGLEYPFPSAMVKPYLGLDATVNVLGSTAANSSSVTREGIGLGAGVEFTVPAFGSFDASVKYQMLNLMGKETGEEDVKQISANLSIMFNVL